MRTKVVGIVSPEEQESPSTATQAIYIHHDTILTVLLHD